MLRHALAGLFAALALISVAAPAPSFGARTAELSIMDDQALLGRSQAEVDSALRRIQALGADRLRVSAFWADIAPGRTALSKPSGFAAENHADPQYNWAALDRVVVSARRHGLSVLISISTPMPFWASAQPRRRNAVWRPRAAEFARFAQAVATRYASFADQFALLNEPNQGAWLQPQSVRGRPVAPHLYRAYVRAAYPSVKRAAPGATVLVGELAPSGRNDPGTTRPIRPLAFLRSMGCVDSRFRRVRTGPCRGFRAVPADAIGHHPYALFRSPFQRSIERDDAAIGDWRRLNSTLDRLIARRAVRPSRGRRLDVFYTEFGYQTDPPDPYAGIPLRRQSRWLQDAAYVAWRTPRVRALNQFRLSDGDIRGSTPLAFREFQSGLWFTGWKPKPAARTFANPIVLRPAGRSRVQVWGQARPGGAHTVTIEHRPRGAGSFRRLATARTDGRGYFRKRVARRTGAYRYSWADPSGSGRSEAVSP